MACVTTSTTLFLNLMSQTNQTFEEFWNDVLDYCDEVNITPQYAEDEFILEGELYCVSVQFVHPTTGEKF